MTVTSHNFSSNNESQEDTKKSNTEINHTCRGIEHEKTLNNTHAIVTVSLFKVMMIIFGIKSKGEVISLFKQHTIKMYKGSEGKALSILDAGEQSA